MKPAAKLNVAKGPMIALFAWAAFVFLLGIGFDLAGVFVYGYYSVELILMIVDIIFCAIYFFASITVLIWNPDNRGRALIIAAGVYVAVSGLYSTITDIITLVKTYGNYGIMIPSVVMAVLELGMGVMSLVLFHRKPKASAILSVVSFFIFGIGNILNAVSYFIAREALFAIFYIFGVLLDFLAIGALISIKKEENVTSVVE